MIIHSFVKAFGRKKENSASGLFAKETGKPINCKMKVHFLVVCTVVLIDTTNGAPEDAVRYRSENPERTIDRSFFPDANSSLSFSLEDHVFQRNSSSYSREQTTTSIPEDDYFWWYVTTSRRPFFSAKDYPGKPGVAVWKEILPGVTSDKRKSKKLAQPTAAGVSSSAILRTRKGTMILPVVALINIRLHIL